jgi:flagellar biosynthesis/type III secretory pathway chaperone
MNLTQNELDERVAVLKHFRQLLTEQRQKFNEYLVVLEKQAEAVEKDNSDAALTYCELETQIVGSIATLQKVIQPVEAMYRDLKPDDGDTEIPQLQTNLEELYGQIQAQNERNRLLLDSHLLQVRNRLDGFRQTGMSKSIYADDSRTASRVQIDA